MASYDESYFTAAIKKAVEMRVKEIAADEADQASKRIAERINKEIDRIALSVFSEYQVTMDGRSLTIVVRKS